METKILKEVYMDLKVEFWGIFAPLLAVVLFHSLAVAAGIVVFAFVMMVRNNHIAEAMLVLKYAFLTTLTLALGVILVGLSAVL